MPKKEEMSYYLHEQQLIALFIILNKQNYKLKVFRNSEIKLVVYYYQLPIKNEKYKHYL